MESKPAAYERARYRSREADALALGGPVTLYPGQVNPDSDGQTD